jgi:hypothetical protein
LPIADWAVVERGGVPASAPDRQADPPPRFETALEWTDVARSVRCASVMARARK